MSPRPLCVATLPARVVGRFGMGLLLLYTLPATAVAQDPDPDRIDITGRQNLTVGSGARAYGMGGAFLARADDATAASWNPAGLSYLRLPEVTLVGAFNSFRQDRPIDGPQGAVLRTDQFRGQDVDFAALTWPVAVRSISGAVQLSYQRAITFDGRREISEFAPRASAEAGGDGSIPASGQDALFVSRFDDVHSEGGFDVIALGTGLRLSRTLRAGFTVNRWLGGYSQQLTRTTFAPSNRPLRTLNHALHLRGWGVNLGLMWSPVESLNLGAVYKTSFTADVTLRKVRRDSWGSIDDLGEVTIDEVTTNAHVSGQVELELPASFGFGLSWRPRDTVTLSADFTRTRWSQARILNFFGLSPTLRSSPDGTPAPRPEPSTIKALQYPLLTAVPVGNDPTDPVRLAGQQDAEQIRAGIEWVLIKGAIRIPLRAGYFNDRQIERGPGGNIPRLNGFSAGVGLAVGSVLLDVAYVYEYGAYSFVDEIRTDDVANLSTVGEPIRSSTLTKRLHASAIYRFGGRP